MVAARGTRCSTGSRRTRSGSSADRSTPASTASIATSAAPRRNKAALIWEGEPGDKRTLTYFDLYREVCQFANVLKSLGVKKGDRVAIYMPLVPELAIAMLACARIGAIHSVVFGGFSAESLRDRINDQKAKLLITADGGYRRGQIVPLKQIADEAVCRRAVDRERRRRSARGRPARRRPRLDAIVDDGRPRPLVSRADAERGAHAAIPSRWTPRTCSTSSTPPAPPGSRRASCTRPAAISSAPTRRPSSSSTCATRTCTGARADIGWVTGHSYVVYGPLANGATVLMYEGAPDWPQKDRFWSLIERYGVTIFYTAPTAIRAFMKWGTEWPGEARPVVAAADRLGR